MGKPAGCAIMVKYLIIFSVCLVTFFLLACTYRMKSLPVVTILEQPSLIPYQNYDYKLTKNLKIIIDKKLYIIPEGFITDLASIPRFFWSVYSPMYYGFVLPAVIHDYFYRSGQIRSRIYADKIFLATLLKNGVSKATAYKFYIIVRIFGFAAFKKKDD